jgi:predicted metal-dependent enzyme (double-stranded beta helix superfamily)
MSRMDTDRERRIQALRDIVDTATDQDVLLEAWKAMVAEINERSPAQVARMEEERGFVR